MNGKPWTYEEMKVVEAMFPHYFASEIAEVLGRSVSGVYNAAAKLGIKSSREKIIRAAKMSSLNPNSIATRFKKGQESHNKGKKVAPATYEKMKATMFKVGHRPTNYRPVGSERVNVDGYVEVKIADPNVWEAKHRVIYEQAYGKVPDGYSVQFKNGNKQDLSLDNLCLVSRADLMKNNSMARYPEELKTVIWLKGAVKRQINKYNKKRQKDGEECKS